MIDCPHTMKDGDVCTVTIAGPPPTCIFCERDALRADVVRLAKELARWKRRAYDHTCCDDCPEHE